MKSEMTLRAGTEADAAGCAGIKRTGGENEEGLPNFLFGWRQTE